MEHESPLQTASEALEPKARPAHPEKEEVILTLTPHWMSLARPFLGYVAGLLLFLTLITVSFSFAIAANFLGAMVLFAGTVGLLVTHHVFFLYLLERHFSDLVMSTHRIVEQKVMPYVKNDSLIVDLHQISEIKKIRHGVFQNIFNYGSLSVLVLGAPNAVDFHNVPYPSKFAHFLEAYKNNAFEGLTTSQIADRFYSNDKFM